MIFLFDIGNTRVKWAVAEAQRFQGSGVFNVTDLHHQSIDKVLDQQLIEIESIDRVWISNVGRRSVLKQLIAYLDVRFSQTVSVVQVADTAVGISNNYQDKKALGVDRWVAAIGARAKERERDLIIIDVGTAVTIDWLDVDNIYQGGVIFPGAGLMYAALLDGTAHIQAEQIKTQKIIGKTTQQSVSAGVDYGLVGAIEGIVQRMQSVIARPTTVLLTGGGAEVLVEEFTLELIYEPRLMLLGLLALANYE